MKRCESMTNFDGPKDLVASPRTMSMHCPFNESRAPPSAGETLRTTARKSRGREVCAGPCVLVEAEAPAKGLLIFYSSTRASGRL